MHMHTQVEQQTSGRGSVHLKAIFDDKYGKRRQKYRNEEKKKKKKFDCISTHTSVSESESETRACTDVGVVGAAVAVGVLFHTSVKSNAPDI